MFSTESIELRKFGFILSEEELEPIVEDEEMLNKVRTLLVHAFTDMGMEYPIHRLYDLYIYKYTGLGKQKALDCIVRELRKKLPSKYNRAIEYAQNQVSWELDKFYTRFD